MTDLAILLICLHRKGRATEVTTLDRFNHHDWEGVLEAAGWLRTEAVIEPLIVRAKVQTYR